jgi:hypothetical protein
MELVEEPVSFVDTRNDRRTRKANGGETPPLRLQCVGLTQRKSNADSGAATFRGGLQRSERNGCSS